MAKKPAPIIVTLQPVGIGSKRDQTFTDWYDLADYLKQCELDGVAVTIFKWRYDRCAITST